MDADRYPIRAITDQMPVASGRRNRLNLASRHNMAVMRIVNFTIAIFKFIASLSSAQDGNQAPYGVVMNRR